LLSRSPHLAGNQRQRKSAARQPASQNTSVLLAINPSECYATTNFLEPDILRSNRNYPAINDLQ
jgi:hypothetical protein